MNIIEKSNEKSILQNVLRPISINPYIYSYDISINDGVKNSCYVYPRESKTYIGGDLIYFDIPQYGLLSKVMIESTLSTSLDNTNHQERPAERMFHWVELQTVNGSRTIQKNTSEYIMLRTDCLDQSTFSRMNVLLEPNVAFNNNTIVFYTPFYGYFSEHPSKFIDTKFVEPLQIVAKIADSLNFLGFPNIITRMNFRIHLTYFTVPDIYLSDSFKYPLSYITLNEYDEPVVTLPTGATSYQFNNTIEKSVFATHLLLKTDNQDLFNINSVQFKVDGKVFYETTNRLSLLDQGWYGNSNLELDCVKPAENLGNRFFSIYWSLYPDRNRNTLCINFKDIGAVDVYITFDSLPDAYNLHIIHEYWDFTTIKKNGEIKRDLIY